MIESRCGLMCSECKHRQQVNCQGCLNIDKPFWGNMCPIQSCCVERGYEYCGLCHEFPYDLLNQFAYDEKQGDDGKRIKQCKTWCLKE